MPHNPLQGATHLKRDSHVDAGHNMNSTASVVRLACQHEGSRATHKFAMSTPDSRQTPASRLLGLTLNDRWNVISEIIPNETATGGRFSKGYIVKSKNDEKAFLKAMDFSEALESDDPAQALESMTAAYNYERALLRKCKTKRLSRVVLAIDDGKIVLDRTDPSSVVQYIIFELADGDIRAYLDQHTKIDAAWILRTMHHATSAIRQLHSVDIVHQDIKPSNVLVFNHTESKLGDLGRAQDASAKSPYDNLQCAGDLSYAPPELLYESSSSSLSPWERRLSCDMYLLGSILVFFCTGSSMTHVLFSRLDQEHHHNKWDGTYSEVLPYLSRAFSRLIADIKDWKHPLWQHSDEIAPLISQLCNPDFRDRGHPKNFAGRHSRYSLERYVSIFDRLAKRAEYSLFN